MQFRCKTNTDMRPPQLSALGFLFKIFKNLDRNQSFVSTPFRWALLCNNGHWKPPTIIASPRPAWEYEECVMKPCNLDANANTDMRPPQLSALGFLFKIFKHLDRNQSFVSTPFRWALLCNNGHWKLPTIIASPRPAWEYEECAMKRCNLDMAILGAGNKSQRHLSMPLTVVGQSPSIDGGDITMSQGDPNSQEGPLDPTFWTIFNVEQIGSKQWGGRGAY